MVDELGGKVALVTGSSRGIGRAIALALAEAGSDIVLNCIHRVDEARATAEAVSRMKRRCVAIQADVSNAAEVQRLTGQAREELGSVDILVNNAGISRPQLTKELAQNGRGVERAAQVLSEFLCRLAARSRALCAMEEIAERDWDELLTVNLKSCFLVTQAVLPGMRSNRWGRVINLSSVAAQTGGVVGPHYAASKAGMIGLTHYYAQRLATEGITVNAIAPALVETEMVTANPNASPERIPMGRFGLPEEVAAVAVMLAKNGYMTGQTVNVNGGWFMS